MRERQAKALAYAEERIRESEIYPYVKRLILFGSCARGEEKLDSDVDLLLVLDPTVKEMNGYSTKIHFLKGIISTDVMKDAETDLKVAIGSDWETDPSTFFCLIRMEGKDIW